MNLNCARNGCPNTFPKNGKQKYCCNNHAKLDGYHRNKKLKGTPRGPKPSIRNSRVNRQTRYALCSNGCGTVTKLVKTQVNTHGYTYHVRIGRVCLTCRTVSIDEKWIVSEHRIRVIPPMGVTA